MKIIKLSVLLFLSLLFSNCQKEATTPTELIGFKIKSITINNVPPTDFGGICWDELDCDNEEGKPDIYLKLEQQGSPAFRQLDFFTSEVLENYSNEQEIAITVPNQVFVFGFLYSFSIYDKDGLEIGDDELITWRSLAVAYSYDPERDVLPTTIGGLDDVFTIELEYVVYE